MLWSVILISLKLSHGGSRSFVSFTSSCADPFFQSGAFVEDRQFSRTARSFSQVSSLFQSNNGPNFYYRVRTVTTKVKSGISKENAVTSNKLNRSPLTKCKETAASVNESDLKAVHPGDEQRFIGNVDSLRKNGSRNKISFNDLKNRFSLHRLVYNQTKDKNSKGSAYVHKVSRKSDGFHDGKLALRTANLTKASKEDTFHFKLPSHPSLSTSEKQDVNCSSTSQVVSREWFFHKADIAIKRPVDDVVLFKDPTAMESGPLSEVALDCMREVMHECLCDNGVRVEYKPEAHFLRFLFPVNIFSQWWSDCFLPGYGPHNDTRYCLHKLYVWLGAYQRVHMDSTGEYITDHCALVLSKELENLKTAVTCKQFRWGDKKNIYLHSPLGSGAKVTGFSSDVETTFIFQDRVVQEVLFLILEPLFEARFSTRSHASRPSRGAHTALRAAQRSFLGCKWFISGDIMILDKEKYAHYLVESALNVVRDSRVAFLLRTGFLRDMSMCSSFLRATQGSSGRLRHLLCNVLLDPLDWWMDDQIRNFAKEEVSSNQGCKKGSLVLLRNHLKQPYKLEYVRFGTKFWVGCNVSEKRIEHIEKNISLFLKKTFGNCLASKMVVSHISAGVNILDHVIAEKMVHPVYLHRRASNGMVFEKRAFKVRLSSKASIERCSDYLKQLAVPASLQQIEQILLVLGQWYCFAENKTKVLTYCKLNLCHMYSTNSSMDIYEEGRADVGFAKNFKTAVKSVAYLQTNQVKADGSKAFFRIPEHEKIFRDQAWLQSRALTSQVRESFKNMRKSSPQQTMAQVLWQYVGSVCDNIWDLNEQIQSF